MLIPMSLLLFYTLLLSNFSSMFLRSPYLTIFLLPEVLQNSPPMVGKWQTLPVCIYYPTPQVLFRQNVYGSVEILSVQQVRFDKCMPAQPSESR